MSVSAIQRGEPTPSKKEGGSVAERYDKVAGVVEKLGMPAKTLRAGVHFIDARDRFIKGISQISECTKDTIDATRALSLFQAPFDIRDTVHAVREVIETKGIGRVKASVKLSSRVVSLVGHAATTCEILHTAGVASESVIQWIPVFNVVYLCSSFVDLGLKVKSIKELHDVQKKFDKLIQACSVKLDDPNQKVKRLAQVDELISIAKENVQALQEKELLSKQTKVIDKIDAIRERLLKPGSTISEEDMKVFRPLKGRVKVLKRLEIFGTVLKVMQLAAIIFITLVPPLAIVGYSILLVTAVVSLVTWGGKFFLINKDPFDENSKSRARVGLEKFRKALDQAGRAISKKISSLSLANRKITVRKAKSQEIEMTDMAKYVDTTTKLSSKRSKK